MCTNEKLAALVAVWECQILSSMIPAMLEDWFLQLGMEEEKAKQWPL